ncbi:putative E3 ubiquitin-protein ligase XBAT34 isoform X1 [Morus notabilis]|uniref:putative E3 ubiquitin-protein ligase XBAT34 isoform X1 n=1 Tax=Morus notabilis TaxID=981085 RepID=UPI000CED5154|nr:putative E3 ubiquitin-protein ligase XBAT34 isoform X1 [Morus notabilis]
MGQNLDSMNQVQPRSKAELLYDIVLATGNVEAIRALFREGASLEWIDREGKNALMVACMNRNLFDAAKTLIELGANVNAYRPGCHAGTPLHHAARAGLVLTVNLLLSSGANAIVRNDDCQTPLDVARQNRHAHVVRVIEQHMCYFSGWVRMIYGPGFLEGLAPYLLSRKIWVVVIPHGPNNPAKSNLELAVYSTIKDARPRSVVSLRRAQIEEPDLSQSDPKLTVFDDSSKSRLKLASAILGDKKQLLSLYEACRGVVQVSSNTDVIPSPIHHNTQTSIGGAELGMASSDPIQPASAYAFRAPNSYPIPEASNTNGWGTSANDDSYNGWGSAVGTTHSEKNNTGWMNGQVKEDHNGWSELGHEPQPLGKQTKHSQTCAESTSSVSKNNDASVSVSSAASAPLIPEKISAEGPIHYPSLNLDEDSSSQPTDDEASASNCKKAGGHSSSCVVCWEAPKEGACIPCGHMACCMSCLIEIKAKKGVCPVCRSKMKRVVRIYAV